MTPRTGRAILGCLGTAVGIVGGAVALLFGGVWLALRDLDLRVDFGGDLDEVGAEPSPAETLRGLDATTGEQRWERRFATGATLVGAEGGTVVVRETNRIRAIEVATGRTTWTNTPGADALAVADGRVLLASGGTVVALDLVTGSELWRVPGPVGGPGAVGPGVLVLATPSGGTLRALDLITGLDRWSVTPFFGSRIAGYSAGSDLLVARDQTGGAVAVDAATGTVRWAWTEQPAADPFSVYTDPSVFAGPTVGIKTLDFSAGARSLTATVFLDAMTGVERWRTPSGVLSSFDFDAATGTLYEYGEGQALLARDPLSGSVRWSAPAPYGRVLAAGPTVYLADECVTAFDGASGAQQWRRCPGGLESGVPVMVAGDALVVAAARKANA